MIHPRYKPNNMINIILSNRRNKSIRRKRFTSFNLNVLPNDVITHKVKPIIHRNINGILEKIQPKETY